MIHTTLVVLQNFTDPEKERGPHNEMSPASSHDACKAISVKAEVFSDLEEEEDPDPIKFPGIKAEPEVSYFSVPMLGRFYKYRYSLFYELLPQGTTYIHNNFFYESREVHTKALVCWGEADLTICLRLPPSQCVHFALFLTYRISYGLDAYISSINICVICALHGSQT
jgi:hypothetical protein